MTDPVLAPADPGPPPPPTPPPPPPGALGNVPPLFKNMPPNVPPDAPGLQRIFIDRYGL